MRAEFWRGVGWVHDGCKGEAKALHPGLKRIDVLAWVRSLAGERCAICNRVAYHENGRITLSSELSAS